MASGIGCIVALVNELGAKSLTANDGVYVYRPFNL